LENVAVKELILKPDVTGMRLDIFVAGAKVDLTRSQAQRLIEAGLVLVGGLPRKANYKLRPGDEISLTVPEAEPPKALPQNIPLDILYEDAEVIVINKPPGLVVHPAAGNYDGTLVNALLYHCGKLSSIGGDFRPGIVHRIDKDTSGVIVAAKTDRAYTALAAGFKRHEHSREYLAVVVGNPKDTEATVSVSIGRHITDRKKMSAVTFKGRMATTHYKVLERYGAAALLSLRLATGRTHQIRVHMAHIGLPLAGDRTYGGPNAGKLLGMKVPRQMLHARMLGFRHPATGEYMEFTADIPPDMARLLDFLRNKKN
jgi:23S rRNA pseudouridine1911/1915/1917 synthase